MTPSQLEGRVCTQCGESKVAAELAVRGREELDEFVGETA